MASTMLQVSWTEGPRVSPLRSYYDPFKSPGREYIWQDDAACGGIDTETFMVNRLGDPEVSHIKSTQVLRQHNSDKIERAKALCSDCPVVQQCLDSASSADRHWSVRGGETPGALSTGKLRMSHGDIPNADTNEYIEYRCRRGRHLGSSYRGEKRDSKTGNIVTYCLGCASM